MNERIFEIIQEINGRVGLQWDDEDKEELAELIVRECADVAWQHTPETEECEYSWLIHNKIKEHFGVEE